MTRNGDALIGAIRVELTDDEVARAREIGRGRDDTCAGTGLADDVEASEEWHVRGAIAEIAVSKLMGVSVDDELYEDGDDGFDFNIKWMKFDVKACKPAFTDDLLVGEHCAERDNPADVFVSAAACLDGVVHVWGLRWLTRFSAVSRVGIRRVSEI